MLNLELALFANIILLIVLHGLQVMARSGSHGLTYALSNLDAAKTDTLFQARLKRVGTNQLEFMVLLTAMVFLARTQIELLEFEALLSAGLIAGRFLYVAVALVGIAYLRSASWLIGFASLMGIVVQIAEHSI